MTSYRCPKCGSHTFQIVDECVHELMYEVEDGIVEAMGDGGGGRRIRITCNCRNCDYSWHPRKLIYAIDR